MIVQILATHVHGLDLCSVYHYVTDHISFFQVIIVAGLSTLALFVTLMSYARFKGLVGS